MPTIMTVHGTFAAGPDRGDHWWQLGSVFETHLRHSIDGDGGALSFEPAHWDGRNSETSRRAAAAVLLKRCVELEQRNETYILIGHSHGGSVVSNAMLLASEADQRLPNLVCAITVGTPFLHMVRTSVLAKIAMPAVLILLFLALLGGLTWLATTPDAFLNRQLLALDAGFRNVDPLKPMLGCADRPVVFDREPFPGVQNTPNSSRLPNEAQCAEARARDTEAQSRARLKSQSMNTIFKAYELALLYGLGILIKLFVEERSRADKAITSANIGRAVTFFGSRWLGFAHGLDEAVGGLSRAISVQAASSWLNPQFVARTAAATSILSGLLLIFALAIWVLLVSAANGIELSISVDFFSAFFPAIGRSYRLGLAIATILLAAIAALHAIRYLTNVGAAWTSRRLDGYLKSLSLGLDFAGLSATAISSQPMWSSQPIVAIPDDIAKQVATFDASRSLQLVESLRQELYASLDPRHDISIPNLVKAMGSLELMHTAYFNSELFRKFLFVALSTQTGLRATPALASDTDFGRLSAWLKAGQARQSPTESQVAFQAPIRAAAP